MPLINSDNEDVRLNRVWLRITPQESIDSILSRFSGFSGDYRSLLAGISSNPVFDDSFYLPLSGEIPSYLFEGVYQKQTPDWGQGGRAMADLLGGFARSTGKIINSLGDIVPVGGDLIKTVGGYATNAGGVISAFAGDIDSPRIWERSAMKALDLEGDIAFENEFEYKYYKAAEIMLTLMTMPTLDTNVGKNGVIDTVAAIGKFFNTSTDGPIQKLNIYALRRPSSGCDIDIFVGKQKAELVKPFDAIAVDEDPNNLQLFALRECNLSSFGISYGGDTGTGFDERGIPRLIKFSMGIEPQTFNSVLSGFSYILNKNRYTKISDVPLGFPPDYAKAESITSAPYGTRARLKENAVVRDSKLLSTLAVHSLIHNILFGNVSAAAATYVGQRAALSTNPVRVLVGAGGEQSFLPGGYLGYFAQRAAFTSAAVAGRIL